jgi:hypothetical protein
MRDGDQTVIAVRLRHGTIKKSQIRVLLPNSNTIRI